jgi:putative hemolysin
MGHHLEGDLEGIPVQDAAGRDFSLETAGSRLHPITVTRKAPRVGGAVSPEESLQKLRILSQVASDPPQSYELDQGRFRVRFARAAEEVESALRLRYQVFNLELGEGLDASRDTGLDEDGFDRVCHHLIVEDRAKGKTVGTYRMQTYEMASSNRWFYSAGEFDLCTIPLGVLEQCVEIGRACVAKEYRNRQVLFLLWRGLAGYMQWSGKRYLFGCSSLTSQNPAVGRKALEQLASAGHAHPSLWVEPHPWMDCRLEPADEEVAGEVGIPILFTTYLRYGAKVLGPPALDREFKTIDFLTLLDIDGLPPDLRRLFFAGAGAGQGEGSR